MRDSEAAARQGPHPIPRRYGRQPDAVPASEQAPPMHSGTPSPATEPARLVAQVVAMSLTIAQRSPAVLSTSTPLP